MLELRDIGYRYNHGTRLQTVALDGVTLRAQAGTVTLVIGGTGSGKSTLLKVAAGLLRPDSGAATIDGLPLHSDSARGRVGIAFQEAEYQLFADSVLDDVRFGPLNLGRSDEEATTSAKESLVAVGLDPELFGERSPFSLSGGEARRAAIAGVLAMRPDYLLLDEPTAGLDAEGCRVMMAAIAELSHRTAVVIVTHEISDFLGVADDVLVLESGRCSWSGAATDLIQEPEVLTRAGLVPPDTLVTQMCVAARYDVSFEFAMDVEVAASAIARVVRSQ